MRRITVSVVAVAAAATTMFAAPLAAAAPPDARPADVHVAGEHVLQVDYQVQETGYWCGPAATRIALSARGVYRSQGDLAAELGTHTGGTDHIGQVTNVLGGYVGWYETKEMPNDPPTQAQRDLLWRDIVLDIDNGYAIVANIVAPPGNQPPGYPPGQTIYHYFTVIGYNDANMTVLIADPASFSGNQIYWLTFNQLATLIPPKGYSA
ncbi:MAG: C39 family peptidase [Actinophytocola sp.]|uniref:C39 family peptidase n=1 Tax=Actinophytocola sp. TaxID=1872138 RepID=UPI003C73367D